LWRAVFSLTPSVVAPVARQALFFEGYARPRLVYAPAN
jgi:hypothetical protein